jgi:hypothetical protein
MVPFPFPLPTYPLRDALVDVLDRYERTPVTETTDALVSLLVAHVVSEQLDLDSIVLHTRTLVAMGRSSMTSV